MRGMKNAMRALDGIGYRAIGGPITACEPLSGFASFRNEKSAQRVSFGAGYPADVHADIPADVRGPKLRSGPRNPGKTCISVRTSMTRRCGRP